MSIWNTLFGWMGVSNAARLDDGSPTMQQDIGCQNPATGLPMASGNCWISLRSYEVVVDEPYRTQ